MPKEEKIKICKLAKKDFMKTNLKEYSKLVKNPLFVCQKCGHVAANKTNLCKPVELEL
jgi:rubrerythrin